jgi:hypothetical protein
VTARTSPHTPPDDERDESPSRRRTYVTVILVQVISLVGLWVFQSYFSR